MAKELKVKVSVDVSTSKLDALAKRINNVNRTAAKVGSATAGINNQITRLVTVTDKWKNSVGNVNNKANALNKELSKSNSLIGAMGRAMRSFASAYLGIMGGRALINASDTITAAENKMNYTNATMLGDAGYNSSGGYSTAALNATQEAMDDMYSASQRARTSYSAMMANVSKSMALSPDAFQGNIDNAIRFQEIMAKTYSLGGASAAEQASSMYQLIQGLGSGILQGDELRSVREGAPLAYKAIEEFAQGIYGADENLKDLASQGKITSDIVVAAIMESSSDVEKAFANTSMTFAQAWKMMKNAALNAFRPIQSKLNEFLNSDTGKQLINGIATAISYVITLLGYVIDALSGVMTFIVNNWSWIQYIFYMLLAFLVSLAVQAIATGIIGFVAGLMSLSSWYLWIIVIGLLVAGLVWLAQTTSSTCEFIVKLAYYVMAAILGVLTIIAIYYLATGTLLLTVPMLIALAIIAAIAIVAALFIQYTQQIMGFIYVTIATIWNMIVGLVNGIIQLLYTSFVESFIGIVEWILNVCNGGFDSFGGAVANLIGQIISWFLSLGKVVTKIIDAIFGTNWTSGLESLQSSVLKWGKSEAAITLSREAPTVMKRTDIGNAWDKGWNVGTNIQNSINSFGTNVKDKISGFGDNLKGKLGLDSQDLFNNAPTSDFGNGYDPNAYLEDIAKADDKTAGNTGNIAKAVDLTSEDLAYLRKVAELEWKKEYTTNTINVDMSNYNTVNGDSDLDGIVTKLRDKLYEELDAVANGVYA